MDKIQVLLVSHQSLFRQGIEYSLSGVEDVEILRSIEASDEVLSGIDTLPPDVALVDVDASSNGGLKLARKIKQRSPSIGVVLLTSNLDDAQLFQALKVEAAACLSKEITADELLDTIRRVARGEHPINENLATRPKLAEQVLQQFQELSRRSEAEAIIAPLTRRETEILSYIEEEGVEGSWS